MDPRVVEIEETLFGQGESLSDYFIVAGSPLLWGEVDGRVEVFFQLIEDNELNRACVGYFREHGVPEYDKAPSSRPA